MNKVERIISELEKSLDDTDAEFKETCERIRREALEEQKHAQTHPTPVSYTHLTLPTKA